MASIQFLLDEGVAVEPVGGVKGKERGHPQHDRSQKIIPDIEVVMRETAPLVRQNAIVGVLGGIFGRARVVVIVRRRRSRLEPGAAIIPDGAASRAWSLTSLETR